MSVFRALVVACLAVPLCACASDGAPPLRRAAGRNASTTVRATDAPRSSSTIAVGTPTTTGPATPSAPALNATGPAGDDGLRPLDGSVRLANFYVDGSGTGAQVDAYWGTEPRPDRRIATVAYGRVTDAVVARGSGVGGDDGSAPQVVVSFFVAGRHGVADRIATASTDDTAGFRLIVELSWSRSYTTPAPGKLRSAATQIIREDQVDAVADGTAAVIVNNLGTMAIGDGSPLQVGPVADCGGWVAISDEFDNGNAGETTFAASPGATTIVAFDADCRVVSRPLRLDLTEGDRVVVFIFGATAASRRLVSVALS